MSTYLKPIAALLISVLIFVGFTYLVDTELQNFIQTRFYNPSVVNSYVKGNNIDSEIVQSHIIELQERFASTLMEQPVRSSFLYNQSADDIYERSRIFGTLLESIGGLQSVKFIDANGLRIHFSTSVRDIISQSRDSTSYRNYNEDPFALPYETVSVPDGSRAKYIMDEQGERIIFSFPFYDSMDVYRGTAIFNISIRTLAERLIAEGRLKASDDVSIVGDPPGILLGSPETAKSDIHAVVAEIWRENMLGRVTIDSEGSDVNYSLISLKTEHGIYFGRLVNDLLFSISEPMKLILKLSIFLTFFLTLFFLINLKPNSTAVVRNRLKRLKDSLFDQLYVNKSSQDRARWILELEQRREEIRSELKYNLKFNKRTEKTLDSIIDKSWDELLAVMKVGSGGIIVQAKTAEPVSASKAIEGIESIEEIEELDDIEEAEALGDAEEIDEIDEVDEIEEAETIDEIEEIEDIEEIEEVKDPKETNIIDIALREAIVPVQPYSMGLLKLATNFLSRKPSAKRSPRGLLALASKKAGGKKGRGLLALASELKLLYNKKRRGLLALATEVELKQVTQPGSTPEYPVMDQETEDLLTNIDIVSPFSSMFSSLDDVTMDE